MIQRKVRKVATSLVISLPKLMLDQINIKEGSYVDISMDPVDNKIIIKPIK